MPETSDAAVYIAKPADLGTFARAQHVGASSTPLRRARASSVRDVDDAETSGTYKRQRTAIACNTCKNRKSRCDGCRPTCLTCAELGFECVYRRPARLSSPRSGELASVKMRLQTVEDLLRSIGPQVAANPVGPEPLSTPPDDPHDPLRLRAAESLQASRHDVRDAHHVIHTAETETVDGMAVITFADEASSGYFGPSSNSAFFAHLAQLLDSVKDAPGHGREEPRHLATAMSRPASPSLPAAQKSYDSLNPYALPSRAQVIRLVESFFAVTGTFFPFIHKTSILTAVEALYGPNMRIGGVRQSWLCLLNAILAIGTSLDRSEAGKSARVREIESDVFFRRALALSPWNMSNAVNLEALQALAVITLYLQGSSFSVQTWRLHGLLIQAAFQVGVHTEVMGRKCSVLEQELRRRTWWMCFVCDRSFSVTFGRPPLIHNDSMQTALPSDVELDAIADHDPESVSFSQPAAQSTSTCSLFIATVKLFKIKGTIIEQLYGQNVAHTAPSRPIFLLSDVLKLDQILSEWKRDLHPVLCLIPFENLRTRQSKDWSYTRSQTALTLRYLSVRVLLYRKVIEDVLLMACGHSQRNGDYELTEVTQSMCQTCADSCIAVIALIRATGTNTDMLPAWWFTSYHSFSASLILFGVVCLQTVGGMPLSQHTPSQIIEYLQIALEDLDIIGGETRIVRRCSKHLGKMIQISSLLAQNYPPQQPTSSSQASPPSDMNLFSGTNASIESLFGMDLEPFAVSDDFSALDEWSSAFQKFGAPA